MADGQKVLGLATLKTDPHGKTLQVLGTLPSGRLLCVKEGETTAHDYDPPKRRLLAVTRGPCRRPYPVSARLGM